MTISAGSGIGPLCEFLRVPVPGGPFPHDNAADGFERDLQRRTLAMYARSLAGMAAVTAVLGAAAVAYRMHRYR
ncbi:sulfotransferase [Actinoplanes sp. NPDC023801]|uniref:sulfotransferase n=1 Tax=Actinoplanes sp. NPDC023801 TaxID=3154595 RepID=UPI00340E12A7